MTAGSSQRISWFYRFYQALILPALALFIITSWIGLTNPNPPAADTAGFLFWVRAARSEVDLDRLAGALLDVTQETMLPERISLHLGEAPRVK